MAAHEKPTVNLPVCFFLLLLFTAAEIGLYEFWRHTRDHWEEPFVPKFAVVLLIFLFTIPKAFIVLSYFMHLRFERSLVVLIALVPFVMVAIAILPTLADIRTLADRNYTKAVGLVDDLKSDHEPGEREDEEHDPHEDE